MRVPRWLIRAISTLVTTAVAMTACASPPAPSAESARLDAAIRQAMADASIPGAIVGVWSPGQDYVRAFGVADTAAHVEMRPDLYSRIGSLTKTFTVTAMLQLVDWGKLNLDDAISRYVEGVPSGDRITLRELAQMRSGLVTFDDVPEFAEAFLADPSRSFTPTQMLGYVLGKPLQFPPGSQYQYSNTNTVLLGLVIEKQSGQKLSDYIGEHILAPLKMTHTSFPTTAAFPGPHLQGYTAVHGAGLTATDWNPSWAWAAGNMISTLDDMRVWARALATGALLTPHTQRQRLDATVPMNGQKSAFYGLGIFNAAGWIGHSGSIFGYQTVVLYLPVTQMTLVFFINTDVPHEAGTVLARAITSVISPDHVYR